MVSMKKRMLTFQTPKKKAMTPLRPARKTKNTEKTEESVAKKSQDKAEDLNSLENKLIEAYREENQYLRNLKSEVLLYNNLLGISITENDNILNFVIERTSTSGHKKLKFQLEDKGDLYVFTLEDSENCNTPECFYDVIEFDKKSFPMFFYTAMRAVYETRVN